MWCYFDFEFGDAGDLDAVESGEVEENNVH